MTPKEQFIAWLNDARSTELAMLPVLKNHANDAKDYPEIYQRDMQHFEETRHQAERLETMITDLGGSISVMKTVIGKVFGLGQSVSTEIFPDELIKNFLADFATESFEIASYQSLIATAQQIGEHQCVPVLEEILREEIAMARWIEEHIPMATAESLKVTTGKSSNKSSRSQTKRMAQKKGVRSRSAISPALTAIVIGGSLGAAATLLLKSKNKKSGSANRIDQTNLDQNIQTNSVELLPEIAVVETIVVVEDEPNNNFTTTSFGTETSQKF